jgi:sulfite oxidase
LQPPDKHPGMIVQGQQPFNAESPLSMLRQSFVTPEEIFYIRNHGSIPEVDPTSYRLTVSGMVESPLNLSLQELRNGFPEETVAATVQCAGNRRHGLMEAREIPGETPWGAGAIGNARWTGVPLREVLTAAGVEEAARHIAFSGLDEIEEGWSPNFGGSIPLYKGMSPEVLLAYEMNGEALSPEHGFPLRVVVPGFLGARSVKWLSEITLQEAPSDNYFQAHEYKLFPPYIVEQPDHPSEGFALGETPLNAVTCDPLDGTSVRAGHVTCRGYAVAGGGRRIERVDLTTDGGQTWVGAELREGEEYGWAWRFWEATLDLNPGEHRIAVRAVDSAADTQPESAASIWNFKGYANNSWHRIMVNAR